MTVADNVRKICAEARPHIEAMLDSAEIISGLRDVAKERGIDWSQLKALLKARIQDDRDGGQRVERLISKADNACSYAAMLGSMAEKNETSPQSNVSHETRTAAEISRGQPSARGGETWPVESLVAPGPSIPEPVLAPAGEPVAAVAVEPTEAAGSQIEAAPPRGVGGKDGDAAMPVTGHSDDPFNTISEFLRRPLPESVE